MKNILKKLFLLIISFTLSLEAIETEKVSIQLQWLDQFQFAGYYMAKEKGYYNDLSLDVEIKKFDYNLDPTKEVLEGRATYGVGRSSLIIQRSNNQKLVLLSAIFQSSPLMLLARKDSNITTIKDFEGKRIMITPDAISTASLYAMKSKKNINKETIIKQKHSFNINDLIDKKTDLMASYISNEPYVLDKKGIPYTIFHPKDYGFDFYSDILFTSENEIKNHKKRAIRFIRASIKGWEYAFENIEETVDLILTKYNPQNKTKEALIYEAKSLKKLAYDDDREIGHISKNKIQRIYDIYNVMGFIDNEIDFDNFIFHEDLHNLDIFTDKELEYLESNPIIKAHNEKFWPPFNFIENGKAKGFSIDYMNLIAQKLGIKVEYVSGYTWSEFIPLLQTDKLDVITNIYQTKERSKLNTFTKGFYSTYNAIFVNSKNKNFNSLYDLNNKKVAVPKDFYIHHFLEEHYPRINLVVVNDSLEALKLLSLKKVDATIGKKVVLDYLITQYNISSVEATNFINDKRAIRTLKLATSKKDTILRNLLVKAQNQVTDEELVKLKEKWFGSKFIQKHLSNISLTNKEKEYLSQNKTFKVCIDPDFAPIEYLDKNIPKGISIDILNIIKEKLDIKLKFIKTNTWEEAQRNFKEKRCDILPNYIKTKQREKFANFTSTYINNTLAIITRDDSPYITDIKQLVNKKMAIKNELGIEEKIEEKFPNILLNKKDTFKEIYESISDAESYFTISTVPVFSYYKAKYHFEDLQIAGYSKIKCNISMAVQKENKHLHSILEKALRSISTETSKVIFDKWSNIVVHEEFNYQKFYKVIFFIIIISISVFVFLIYRQNILDNYNQKLKDEVDKAISEVNEKNQFLEKKQEEQQLLLDTTIEAVMLFDTDKRLIFINKAGIELFGFPSLEEAKKFHIMDFIPQTELEKTKLAQKKQITKPYELLLKKYDKTTFPALAAGRELIIDNKKVKVAYAYDLTEVKEKDQYLYHQSRFAQMGEMISMIAHQWRQPLNSISATANNLTYKLLLDEFEKEEFEKELALIGEYSQYLSQTIDDFRNFFKENKEKRQTTLEDIIKSVLNIAKVSLTNKDIRVVTKFECNKLIETYDNELKQVILNFVKNAEDALKDNNIENPTIVIETKALSKNMIIVKDNAGGIPEDIIDYIFDPYFSTKKDKNGTGLGLFMSKNIIEDHLKGKLSVKNDESGAVFTVEI